MTDAAALLKDCTKVLTSSVRALTDEQAAAARQAVYTGEGIDHLGLRYIPDVLAEVETFANGTRVPRTAILRWPDDADPDVAGRSVHVFAVPDPRPPHPERVPRVQPY